MHCNNTNKIIGLLILCLGMVISCATPQPQPAPLVTQYPLKLEVAIRTLVNDLLQQLPKNPNGTNELSTPLKIVLDPFVDMASGEVVQVSRQMEQLIVDEIHTHSNDMTVSRMTSQNIRQANYVINGTIHLENYEVGTGGTTPPENIEKFYRVSSSMVNLGNAKIIAHSDVWISEKELNYTPIAAYQDSPMYLKDKRLESLVTTAKTPSGQSVSEEYYNGLDTHALLAEADTLYEQSDYEKALLILNKAASRSDGNVMKTYAGLYETHRKLDHRKDAEQAFARLLAVSVQETQRLNMKFLFKVNSADFIEESVLREEYSFWLNQITEYFSHNQDQCFHIVGHSSHSGKAAYNENLSKLRAQKVQKLMKPNFPQIMQRSQAMGKGFEENLVGLGTDDARDAIDRRVEIVIVNCSQLGKELTTF